MAARSESLHGQADSLGANLCRTGVIAIENVRLFQELQDRNRDLSEALEHQTATSEVLGIISRSPTDVQPVLDAIVESAARVCGIDDVVLRLRNGNILVARAHFGSFPIALSREEISIDELHYRWVTEHGTLHVHDRSQRSEFPTVGAPVGARSRTFLIVPVRIEGELIGTLNARRVLGAYFYNLVQIKLFETFADQAVIAIENVRLFQEFSESLEQQTATSEILGVIASSPTNIQPVLEGGWNAHDYAGPPMPSSTAWMATSFIRRRFSVLCRRRQKGHRSTGELPVPGHR